MSVITTHILKCTDENVSMTDLLKENIGENTLIGYDREVKDYTLRTAESVLDLTKCAGSKEERNYHREKGLTIGIPKEETEKIELHKQKGYEVFQNDGSYTTLRRTPTEEELDALLHEKVTFAEDGSLMLWFRNYNASETPAYLISLEYPDKEFSYMEFCESDRVCDVLLKNGEVIRDILKEERENEERDI